MPDADDAGVWPGYRFGMADGASPSLAEVMAAMSIAVDIGMGQPMEQGLGVCLLAVRFGELVGLDGDQLQEVFEVALLRHIGCTAEAADFASIMGDELLARATGGPFVDWANPTEALRFLLGHLVRSLPPAQAAYKIARLPAAMPRMRAGAVAVCEVASLLAGRFAMPDRTRADLVTVYERWDGKGFPGRLSGEAIPLCGRIVQLAETAWVFAETAGPDAAESILRRRSGTALDPQLVERFCGSRDLLLAGPGTGGSLWEVTLSLEPKPRPPLTPDELDAALRAFGEFADLKSFFTVGHSLRVAELAAGAADLVGLPAVQLRQAGWLHGGGLRRATTSGWTAPAITAALGLRRLVLQNGCLRSPTRTAPGASAGPTGPHLRPNKRPPTCAPRFGPAGSTVIW